MDAGHGIAARVGAAVAGCIAALAFSISLASADPTADPHKPDITRNYCPGGRWNIWGLAAGCDGDQYPDGSFWHQSMELLITGPQFSYECVVGVEPNLGPPPPGGCDGAIPAA